MVTWDADKDRIILMGIFKFHEIKNSKPLLDYLAKEIGGGCTAKAVSHRLSNLRSSGKMTSGGTSNAGSPAGVKKSVATPRTPRTPGSARARFSKKAAREEDEEDETATEEGSADETVATPSMNRQRRASQPKRSYAESDAASDDEEEGFTPINKKVKKEPAEEEVVPSAFAAPGASAFTAPSFSVPAEPEDVEFV